MKVTKYLKVTVTDTSKAECEKTFDLIKSMVDVEVEDGRKYVEWEDKGVEMIKFG